MGYPVSFLLILNDRLQLNLPRVYGWLLGGISRDAVEPARPGGGDGWRGDARRAGCCATAWTRSASARSPPSSWGSSVESDKRMIIVLGSVLTGAAVALGGLIGFVGLFAPHVTRVVLGPRHGLLLPAAALVGAAFLVLADLLARALLPPTEIPVGILTALRRRAVLPVAAAPRSGASTGCEHAGARMSALELQEVEAGYGRTSGEPVVLHQVNLDVARRRDGRADRSEWRRQEHGPARGGGAAADGRAGAASRTRPERASAARDRPRRWPSCPQEGPVPPGLIVRDMVGLGRTPYLRPLLGPTLDRSCAPSTGRWTPRACADLARSVRGRAVGRRAAAGDSGARAGAGAAVLLLDEPTANLDLHHQVAMLELVRGLSRERELAVLAAVHDLQLAALYCDRVVLLTSGRVLGQGPPEAVLTRAAAVGGVRAAGAAVAAPDARRAAGRAGAQRQRPPRGDGG